MDRRKISAMIRAKSDPAGHSEVHDEVGLIRVVAVKVRLGMVYTYHLVTRSGLQLNM